MNSAETTPKSFLARYRLPVGAGIAALGIAAAVWLSNGSSSVAGECTISEAQIAAIDEVAVGELAALLADDTGRNYAEMSFQDLAGEGKSIADFAGKRLLVNFWATWCGPCREEMPDLNALQAEYGSDAFEVLTINLDLGNDGPAKGQAFLDEHGLDQLELFADPTFKTFEDLRTQGVSLGLPTTLLLDEAGCEVAVLRGPAVWHSQDGKNVVEALIGA